MLISCFHTHVKPAIILHYKSQNINVNLYIPLFRYDYGWPARNVSHFFIYLFCCTSTIPTLLDTDDRALIAYMDDVHDKEESTIKNMSGSFNAMLRLRLPEQEQASKEHMLCRTPQNSESVISLLICS